MNVIFVTLGLLEFDHFLVVVAVVGCVVVCVFFSFAFDTVESASKGDVGYDVGLFFYDGGFVATRDVYGPGSYFVVGVFMFVMAFGPRRFEIIVFVHFRDLYCLVFAGVPFDMG